MLNPAPGAAVRLCHRKYRANPGLDQRAQPALLLSVGRDYVQQMSVAFVRRLDVERQSPQGRIPGGLEHHRHAAVIKAETAVFGRAVGGQQPGRACLLDHLLAKVVVRPVILLPWIVLIGNDFVPNECVHPVAQVDQIIGQGKVDHVTGILGEAVSRVRT